MNKEQINAWLGIKPCGVVYGFENDDPATGLVLTYTEGLVRVKDNSNNPLGYTEYRVAGSTATATAGNDCYVYISGTTGAVVVANITSGSAKPKIGGSGANDIPANSQFLYKIEHDDSDMTAIHDLREHCGDIVCMPLAVSFETAEVGTIQFTPGFRGKIIALDGIVTNALADTDAGTVTPSIVRSGQAASAVADAVLSFAASATVGTRDLEVASDTEIFGPRDRVQIVGAKSTAGGLVCVTVVMERTG